MVLSVRPSSRQARRTAPPDINGVNALAFGTLFSSQGASADPKEGTPRRWGRATHHGRHAGRGRQPNSCPDPALLRFARKDTSCAERSNGRSGRRWQDPGLAGARVGVIGSKYAWRSPPFPRYPELLCPDLGPLRSDIAQIRLRGSADVAEGGSLVTSIQEALEDLRMGHGDPGDGSGDRRVLARRRAARAPVGRQPDLGGPRPDLRRGVVCERGTRLEYREPAEATARTDPVRGDRVHARAVRRRGRGRRDPEPHVVSRCIGQSAGRRDISTAWS